MTKRAQKAATDQQGKGVWYWAKTIGGSILAVAAGWVVIANAIEKSPIVFDALRFQTSVSEINKVKQNVKKQEDLITLIAGNAANQSEKITSVETVITEKADEIERQVKSITESAAKAKATAESAQAAVDKLKEISDFQLLIIRANADGRKAFEELRQITLIPDHPYRTEAANTVSFILSNPIINDNLFMEVAWSRFNIDPEKATLEEFTKFFRQLQVNCRTSFFKTLWNAKQIKQSDKLALFYSEIKNTPNTSTLAAICSAIDQDRKSNENILLYQNYVKYLEDEIEKLPKDAPTKTP